MGKEIIMFDDIEIEKHKFYRYESPISEVDIDNVLVSNKSYYGEKNYKYFIGYFCGDYKINLLSIMLPRTRAYVKSSDCQIKWMSFLFEGDDLMEKYNTICNKVSAVSKNKYDTEPVYNKIFLKTKLLTLLINKFLRQTVIIFV